jgi:aspartyl-tRNA(Asn)/glutamyl-tRNA(Gln) amidotransferase subunit A
VGIPAALIAGVDCDPTVLAAWQSTLATLGSAGFALREADAPPPSRGIGAVFAANLAARWGDVIDAEPRDLVHPDVRAGVEYGRSLTVRDYLGACDALTAARRRAESLFAEVDLLALPTAPVLPPPPGDPAPVSAVSAFTRPWSAFGYPAVTLPCPAGEGKGCGIQFIARPGDDIRLLSWASGIEEIIGGLDVAASA